MTVHNHPPYRPVCNERRVGVDGQLRGACLNDDGSPAAPAYLDPIRDELDRLRTENARLTLRVENSELRETDALMFASQAEARVDQLTDTLRYRTDALNRTGADNDQLRAKVARVRKWAADEALDACTCGHGLDEHNGLGCYARLSYAPLVTCDCPLTDDRTHGDLARQNLRTILDDQPETNLTHGN